MPFALDPSLPLPRAVRKLALDELRAALRHLKRGTVHDVHEARKSTKRLRAWARLLRPVLRDDYVVINRLLRDAARAVAGNRERTAALATLTSLKSELAPDARAEVLQRVLIRLPAGTRRQRANGRHLSERLLRIARLYVQRATLTATRPESLRKRLVRNRKQCRAACARASCRPTAMRMHEWRKLAKYQTYQRAMLAPLFPELTGGIGSLKRLGDVLGRHHDLAVLAGIVRREPGDTGRQALKSIRDQQLKLQERAFAVGAKLFA